MTAQPTARRQVDSGVLIVGRGWLKHRRQAVFDQGPARQVRAAGLLDVLLIAGNNKSTGKPSRCHSAEWNV
jgi:hypothetical protein